MTLDWDLSDTWKFMHFDDASCAQEIGVAYPGISLFRFFTNEPYQVVAQDSAEGEKNDLTVDTIKETLWARDTPELIAFSEEFINTVMA